MGCGVLALVPPPSYAAAMNTVQRTEGEQNAVVVRDNVRGGTESTSRPITIAGEEGKTLPKDSPPPYDEETSRHAIHLNVISVVRTEPMTQSIDVSSV